MADADASEPGSNTGAFTVTRSGAGTVSDLTVLFAVGGTATPAADYVTLSGSVTRTGWRGCSGERVVPAWSSGPVPSPGGFFNGLLGASAPWPVLPMPPTDEVVELWTAWHLSQTPIGAWKFGTFLELWALGFELACVIRG